MRVSLLKPLRIETSPVGSRLVTRIFHGDRELKATPATLATVMALCAARQPDLAALTRLGILEPEGSPEIPDLAQVTLGRLVSLELEFQRRTVTLPTRHGPHTVSVQPQSSLPISIFIPPYRLHPLQALADRLRTAYLSMLRAAHARRRLLEPADALPHLVELASVAAHEPALQPVVEWDGRRFTPVVPLQESAIQYSLKTIHFRHDRNAGRSESPQTIGITFRPETIGEELPAIGRFLGDLAHGAPTGDLKEQFRTSRPIVQQFWSLATRLGQIAPTAVQPRYKNGLAPGAIVHLGHATLLANIGDQHILIDPWFPAASASDSATPPSVEDLPVLSAIFITHHHWDHVHFETLLRLPKAIPVYIPSPAGEEVQPRIEPLLRMLGFSTVVELPHGASVTFGASGQVTAFPFFGEDPEHSGWTGNTYVLTHAERSALVHVDSGTDRHGNSWVASNVSRTVQEKLGPIDLVFATRRQERGSPIEYGFEFLLRPAEEWLSVAENGDNPAAFLADLVEATGARTLVLYSEGGADWYPEGTDFLRRPDERNGDGWRTLYWDDLETIERKVAEKGAKTILSTPFQEYSIALEN